MNHLRYTPEAFKPDGSLRTVPPEEVAATLGKYGMVHPLMNTEASSTIQEQEKLLDLEKRVREAGEAKSARIQESLVHFFDSAEGKKFKDMYEVVFADVSKITELVGETPPTLENSPFRELAPSLMESYILFEKLGLGPQLVLAPAHRSEQWWLNLYKLFQDSPLNPTEPDPEFFRTKTQPVLRNGGLNIAKDNSTGWGSLTGSDSREPSWSLCVMSASNKPHILKITAYGFLGNNTQCHPDINKILTQLGKPSIKDRNPGDPLIPLDIHPSLETYLMHMLSFALNKTTGYFPDNETWSWLDGILGPNNLVPVATWTPRVGMVELSRADFSYRDSETGIRPTAKGTTL